MINQERNEHALRKLINQYDPEFDVGSPRVTYTDMALIIIINDLIETVNDLEGEIEKLKKGDNENDETQKNNDSFKRIERDQDTLFLSRNISGE